jgi:3-deoxy-D-manno-octulosonic-acid transferase
MHSLYNILLVPVRWLASLAPLRFLRHQDRRAEWSERRARKLPSIRRGGLWLHGSSVGEAGIVTSLAVALRRSRPQQSLAASAVTRAGRACLPGPPVVDAAFFMPLDISGYPSRLLDALHAAGLVLVETELWPNLIRETGARQIPIIMVNGRLSPSRMRRYLRFGSLYRPLLQSFAALGIQSEDDAGRFMELRSRRSSPPGSASLGTVRCLWQGPQAPERKRWSWKRSRRSAAATRTHSLSWRPVTPIEATGFI